jgi:hypothetical protein
MTATLAQWYEEHGKHELFAGGQSVKLDSVEHHLALRREIVTIEEQRDLDRLGVAKNSREEKARARDREMAKLYHKHILKEPDSAELMQIGRK